MATGCVYSIDTFKPITQIQPLLDGKNTPPPSYHLKCKYPKIKRTNLKIVSIETCNPIT